MTPGAAATKGADTVWKVKPQPGDATTPGLGPPRSGVSQRKLKPPGPRGVRGAEGYALVAIAASSSPSHLLHEPYSVRSTGVPA